MPNLDIKLLRDELAKVIGENKRRKRAEEEMSRKIVELALKVDQIILERDQIALERDQANAKVELLASILKDVEKGKIDADKISQFYDNAHTTPRQKTITQREINKEKKKERRQRNPEGKRGRKKGCEDHAVSRKATQAVRHSPQRCALRDGRNLKVVGTTSKNVVDIPVLPQAVVTCHIVETCECSDCHGTTVPNTGLLDGTSLGSNLVKIVTGMWEDKMSYQDIANTLSSLFGVEGCAKSTIQHVLDSVADAMGPEANSIKSEMNAKTTPVNIDETPYPVLGDICQGWVATDPDSTVVEIAGGRGVAVLDAYFPYHKRPVTADGLASYNIFEVRQRCWAHILRESDRHVRAVKKRAGVSQTDCHNAETRHRRLQQLYHEAKSVGTATAQQCEALVKRLLDIAATYPGKFANKLASATGNLFTFLLYEGMEPTNNAAEREIRSLVIHRKIRDQIGSKERMRRFGALLTCILTWRKRGLNFYQEMDRILQVQA